MRRVGVRELKDKLSRYLRLVRDGEQILVTDRGRVVAELRPPTDGGTGSPIDELVRVGLATPAPPNDPTAYPDMPSTGTPGLAERLLDAERGER